MEQEIGRGPVWVPENVKALLEEQGRTIRLSLEEGARIQEWTAGVSEAMTESRFAALVATSPEVTAAINTMLPEEDQFMPAPPGSARPQMCMFGQSCCFYLCSRAPDGGVSGGWTDGGSEEIPVPPKPAPIIDLPVHPCWARPSTCEPSIYIPPVTIVRWKGSYMVAGSPGQGAAGMVGLSLLLLGLFYVDRSWGRRKR